MFENQFVWITGASAGIGREMAIQFARNGAHVAVSARREERLNEVVMEIKKTGQRGLAVACDVSREEDVRKAVDQVIKNFGQLDIVVANAGFGVGGKIEDLQPSDWKRQFDVNVIGLISSVIYAIPHIRKTNGRVVLMGSVSAMISSPGTAAYSATKAAVKTIGETLSVELYGSGISCTTIHPGFIKSEINQVDNTGRFRADWQDRRPKFLMWPTDKAVKVMLKAIKKRRRSVVITGHGKVLAFFGRHFPDLVYWATVKNTIPLS